MCLFEIEQERQLFLTYVSSSMIVRPRHCHAPFFCRDERIWRVITGIGCAPGNHLTGQRRAAHSLVRQPPNSRPERGNKDHCGPTSP
jgi:hypothetical protein